MSLLSALESALARRQTDIASWADEDTDSYRLFHGAVEGRPGLSVDRYGPLILAQVSSSRPLTLQEEGELWEFVSQQGAAILASREGSRLTLLRESVPELWSSCLWCRELGLELALDLSRAHRDPQLFLDFRATKRALKAKLAERQGSCSVLNLFAYTCSISCHAAQAGADEVWSADFSAGNLAWGQKNFRRNRLACQTRFVEEDCIGLLWALTGQKRALSRRGKSGGKLLAEIQPRTFSIVVVDPPAWSTGKFAAVDLVRDPETVFGPAWEVVSPGGLMIAANNSAKVPRAAFAERLRKMLDKRSHAGICQTIQWVAPDSDFPSFDGEHPLKVAICHKN